MSSLNKRDGIFSRLDEAQDFISIAMRVCDGFDEHCKHNPLYALLKHVHKTIGAVSCDIDDLLTAKETSQ